MLIRRQTKFANSILGKILGSDGSLGTSEYAWVLAVFDDSVPTFLHKAWRGRIRASAGIASLPEAERERFDRELTELLKESFPFEPVSVPHGIFAIVATAPHSPIE